MLKTILSAGLIAMSAAIAVSPSPAFAASKLEKVDMVREGIDMTPVIVKANSNGYTGYQTPSHTYLVRLYAKGKGGYIYWAAISNSDKAHPITAHPLFFNQSAAKGTEGWSVYKKSLQVSISVDKTYWLTSPKALCAANMAEKMAKGKSKADVLKTEWKLTAQAGLYFVAAADSKSNNKKQDHKINKIDVKHKGILYPVAVVCKKGM